MAKLIKEGFNIYCQESNGAKWLYEKLPAQIEQIESETGNITVKVSVENSVENTEIKKVPLYNVNTGEVIAEVDINEETLSGTFTFEISDEQKTILIRAGESTMTKFNELLIVI